MDDQTARANEEMERQRERIGSLEYQLEKSTQRGERRMDLVSLGMEVMKRQQERIQELESKLGDADRTYLHWRGEALMLEKRLFKLMEDADRDRGEIKRLNRMLLKALETLLLEE